MCMDFSGNLKVQLVVFVLDGQILHFIDYLEIEVINEKQLSDIWISLLVIGSATHCRNSGKMSGVALEELYQIRENNLNDVIKTGLEKANL